MTYFQKIFFPIVLLLTGCFEDETSERSKYTLQNLLNMPEHTQVSAEFAQTITETFQSDSTLRGKLSVPLDYNDAASPTIELAYVVRLADQAPTNKAFLWINYGGPGMSGIDKFNAQLTSNPYPDYNLVVMEPRGVGHSAFGDYLKKHITVDLLPWIGTNKLAHDMERLRAHIAADGLGGLLFDAEKTDKINLLGISYGSLAFANYTHFYPEHVRHLILDGVDDLLATPESDISSDMQKAWDVISSSSKEDMKKIANYFREEQNDSVTAGVSKKKRFATGVIRCADWGYSYVSVQNKNPSWYEKEFVFKKSPCGDNPEDRGDSLFHLRDSVVLQTLDFPVLLLNCDTDFRTPISNAERATNILFANKFYLITGKECARHALNFALSKQVQAYLSDQVLQEFESSRVILTSNKDT